MPPPLKDDVDNGFETAIDSRLIISPDNAEGMPDIVVEDGIEYQTLEFRRETVKEMMNHAWSNYVKYTWGGNELKPIARTANPTGIFGSTKLGASIVDAADTLFIMGMEKEFNDVRNWIQDHLILDGVNRDISVFELNIRFIGGLLSSHALSNDTIFLDKAVRFADRILPVFETSTGIPMALLNPTTNHSKIYPWASGALLGEVGSLHLEFTRLSFLTGNPIYAKKVQKIRDVLEKTPKIMADQLYPNYIHPWTGKWGQRKLVIVSYKTLS
jgi:mannosyl-oligosaccharide alpha-1,2-mannosidase